MSEYTLDDLKFSSEPLTLYEPDGEISINEEVLKAEREKNKAMLEQVKHLYEERTGKAL